LGHAARGGLDEHDPEPLLLEAAPARAAAHGEHVGAPVEKRQVGVGHAPEEVDGGAGGRRQPGEAGGVAAAAGDGDGEPATAAGQAVGGLDEDVEALAGDEAAHAEHEREVVGQPEVAAGLGPLAVVERAEARHVDTRRHDHRREVRPGGAPSLGGGIATRRNHQLGVTQDAAEQTPAARDPSGHRHFGAVHDDGVRVAQRRAELPER
jgi:hypothetical protein